MLLDVKYTFELLRCPISGSQLLKVGDRLCVLGDSSQRDYQIIQGYPVLINFDESIFRLEDMQVPKSIIPRSSHQGLTGVVKRLILPPKATTAKNVDKIFDLAKPQKTQPKGLIVGGGTVGQGMQRFYTDPDIDVVAFDVYASSNVQFIADAHYLPLPDECFDFVIIQAVLEHVLNPKQVVAEIHRVLKQNGIVYAETPFLQHVHEGAYDFTRFTESGHRYLFKDFELIRSGVSAGAGTQLLWSIDNFFRGLFRSRKIGKAVKLCFFWLCYLDYVIPDTYNVDAASGVFFLGRKSSSSISRRSIVTHYKGAQ